MATVKISQLTAAAAATGTQELEVNESGTSKKITGAQLATYIEGEVSSSPIFTGQVSLPDGTNTLPSLTNTGDTNTGIYFPAEDEVGIATGGTLRVSVNSGGSLVTTGNIELGHATDTTISRSAAGVIAVEGKPVVMTTGAQTVEFAAGTVSLPSITTTGDTNTGIFFPAADTIAFTEGGVETFRIGSSGQLGVAGANYGTSGQVLTSGGASAAPSWATVSGITQTTGSAPYYGARAWVNFDGSNTANATGTYSQSGTTVTVTVTAHGLSVGNIISIDITSGTAADSDSRVVATVPTANTFTYTAINSLTTSGNCTLKRQTIRGSKNVSSVSDNATGSYTVNFITVMADANYCIVANAKTSNSTTADTTIAQWNDVNTGGFRLASSQGNNAVLVDAVNMSAAVFS